MNLQLGYRRPSGTRPLLTNQALYAEDGIGSTVLGQYANQRSANSAAPAGQNDSTEIIYLPTASGPMPIAAEINGRLYAIHTDHLNTPRRLTNQQGQVAWQWLISGFGEVRPTTGAWGYGQTVSGFSYAQTTKFNLRYPSFDRYNNYRALPKTTSTTAALVSTWAMVFFMMRMAVSSLKPPDPQPMRGKATDLKL